MHIGCADVESLEVIAQFFGHTLRQRGHQGALAALDAQLYLLDQVIDLTLGGAHDNLRIEQACRADELFGDNAFTLVELIVGGGSAHIDGLVGHHLKFLKTQGSVVQCRFESESIVHQIGLAGLVATVHGAYLRHSDMALINDGEEVIGEIIQQAERPHAGPAAVKVAAVVLDA